MKLGILVNSDRYCDNIVGITRAACSQGHEVILFAMDTGTFLLQNKQFTDLHSLDGVQMSFCEHSAKELHADYSHLPDAIIPGSQYNNADMNSRADKVIVL